MPNEVRWTRPAGGFFVWLTLPEPMKAREVLTAAHQRSITFLTGETFYAQGGGERHIAFRSAISRLHKWKAVSAFSPRLSRVRCDRHTVVRFRCDGAAALRSFQHRPQAPVSEWEARWSPRQI